MTIPPSARPPAYSYVRFSSKRQADGDSLRRQVEKSKKYAREHGLDLREKSYQDLGISAFDQSNLKVGELKAFIDAVDLGLIERGSYLLVESLDRLSRADVTDALNLLTSLVKKGVRVVTLSDNGRVWDEVSIKDSVNVIMALLIFVRANEESVTKSERVSSANAAKRAAKHPTIFSNEPGWLQKRADGTGYESIPAKAASVVKVFEQYAKGHGSTFIARLANKERWPVPGTADDWHKTLPHKLVHNRRVLGELSPEIVLDGKRVPTGECFANYYPRIVSEELFHAARAAALQRRRVPNRRDGEYRNVFQGLLKCGACGATFARKPKTGKKNSEGYAIYVCANRDRGMTVCENWNARELEELLIPPAMHFVRKEVVAGAAQKAARDKLEQARAAKIAAETNLARYMTAFESLSPEEVKLLGSIGQRMRVLVTEVESLGKQVEELSLRAADPGTEPWEGDIEDAVEKAAKALKARGLDGVDERQALHQAFLRHVKSIHVWPRSHAHLTLNNSDVPKLLPLCEHSVLNALDFDATISRFLGSP